MASQLQIDLPPSWVKWTLVEDLPVFYNWDQKIFSFSPVMDMLTFIQIANQLLSQRNDKEFSLEDLNNKISDIEHELRRRNNGQMPEMPKTLEQQIQDLIGSEQQSLPKNQKAASKPNPEKQKKRKMQASYYKTELRLADIKQIKEDTDPVSALTHIAKQCFQLEPSWQFDDSNQEMGSRFKFIATCKFFDTQIARCQGQSKQDAKKQAARVALSKVASNLYEDLFQGDPVPKEFVPIQSQNTKQKSPPKQRMEMEVQPKQVGFGSQQQMAMTFGKESQSQFIDPEQALAAEFDDKLRIGSQKMREMPANDECFRSYKPKDIYSNQNTCLKWGFVENESFRENPGNHGLNKAHIFELKITKKETQQIIFHRSFPVISKVRGRIEAYLEFLSVNFGPQYDWNQLMQETREIVNQARAMRNAPERPIFKSRQEYLQEQMMAQMTTSQAKISAAAATNRQKSIGAGHAQMMATITNQHQQSTSGSYNQGEEVVETIELD